MLAIVLTVPANEVELASDALWALGVAAVEERSPAARGRAGDRGSLRRVVDLARQRRRRDHPGRRRLPRPLALAHGRSRPGGHRELAGPRRPVVDRSRARHRPGLARRRDAADGRCGSTSTRAPRSGSAITRRRSSLCGCCARCGGPARPSSTSGAGAACCPSSRPVWGRPTSKRSTVAAPAIEATVANASRNGVMAGSRDASTPPPVVDRRDVRSRPREPARPDAGRPGARPAARGLAVRGADRQRRAGRAPTGTSSLRSRRCRSSRRSPERAGRRCSCATESTPGRRVCTPPSRTGSVRV